SRRAVPGLFGVLLRWVLLGGRIARRAEDLAGIFAARRFRPPATGRLEAELGASLPELHAEAERAARGAGDAHAEPGTAGDEAGVRRSQGPSWRHELAGHARELHLETRARRQHADRPQCEPMGQGGAGKPR